MKSKGFILLMTLLMMSVLSLLLLSSMQHVLLYYKAINQLKENHKDFYQLEYLSRKLAERNLTSFDRECFAREEEPNKVIKRLASHKGCPLRKDNKDYRFLIEDLGPFPCLMTLINNKPVSTHHIRISLLAIGNNKPDALLQLRNIKASSSQLCEEQGQVVPLGVSSWRYFAAI